ncbi:MAG: hypothetical protein ACKOC5_02415 [Chloroflexota bacterium]
MSVRTAPRVGLSFEYLMWIFLRISGLFMYLFFFIGVGAAFAMEARIFFSTGTVVDIGTLARWAFFPISTHVSSSNIPDITLWSNAWWQILQYMMLVFAATHGMNGVRQVIEDYVGSTWGRTLIRALIFFFWLFILLVGFQLINANLQSA